jgi:hypothetical protein
MCNSLQRSIFLATLRQAVKRRWCVTRERVWKRILARWCGNNVTASQRINGLIILTRVITNKVWPQQSLRQGAHSPVTTMLLLPASHISLGKFSAHSRVSDSMLMQQRPILRRHRAVSSLVASALYSPRPRGAPRPAAVSGESNSVEAHMYIHRDEQSSAPHISAATSVAGLLPTRPAQKATLRRCPLAAHTRVKNGQ